MAPSAFGTILDAATARPAWSTLDDLEEALPRLPEVFDKRNIARVLGYTPPYTTLARALEALEASARS